MVVECCLLVGSLVGSLGWSLACSMSAIDVMIWLISFARWSLVITRLEDLLRGTWKSPNRAFNDFYTESTWGPLEVKKGNTAVRKKRRKEKRKEEKKRKKRKKKGRGIRFFLFLFFVSKKWSQSSRQKQPDDFFSFTGHWVSLSAQERWAGRRQGPREGGLAEGRW